MLLSLIPHYHSITSDTLPRLLYTTRWIWDGNSPLHEWTETEERKDSDDTITWVFEADGFTPMAKLVGDESYSIITDHLGTPSQLYDSRGKKVWQGELDIHGKLRTLWGSKKAMPFRYPGQYEDSETGLYYNRFIVGCIRRMQKNYLWKLLV